jgi:hypothetical protein
MAQVTQLLKVHEVLRISRRVAGFPGMKVEPLKFGIGRLRRESMKEPDF